MNDIEYDDNKKAIDEAFDLIPQDKIVVLPEDGIGTGLAQLEQRAPRTWAYLQKKINILKNRTDKFYINKTYKPKRYNKYHPDVINGLQKEGFLMRYESTGDVMYSFQEPTLLKHYIPTNMRGDKIGERGEYYVDMTPNQF